jgi:hypothetical protein
MPFASTTLQANLIAAGFTTLRVVPGPMTEWQAAAAVLSENKTPKLMDGRAFFSPEAPPSEAILRAGWGVDDAYKESTLEEIQKQARALYNAPWGNLSSHHSRGRKPVTTYRAIIIDPEDRKKETAHLSSAVLAVLSSARFDDVGCLWLYLDAFGMSGSLEPLSTASAIVEGLKEFWKKTDARGKVGPAHVVFDSASKVNFEAFKAAIAG